ncbi:MFS transporter [Kineosporia mesophila]|uniref:MFS transporter n=2 Tax=Kineosporia mesophila TaxID=566012 RepID=A0ABP6Z9Z1_9ACTN
MLSLLTAQAVSLIGTRMSMIAIPWLVLVTSGSATQTGLVAFAEMTPLVIGKVLAGPLIDRVGPRIMSVTTDAISMIFVAAIPALHHFDRLPFGVLLVLVAGLGAARGPGDVAKQALVPEVAAIAEVPLERVTGMIGTLERIAGTAGPALAGILIALVDPLFALYIDAATFAVAALIIGLVLPRRARAAAPTRPEDSPPTVPDGTENETYRQQLAIGARFLAGDKLLLWIAIMLAVTNLIDAGWSTVLLPVWARQDGGGPAAIGAVGTAFGGAAIIGSALATGFAHRLPRRLTYLVAFLIGGAPRFVVLAVGAPLWVVLVVSVADGIAIGFVNPILSAVLFERIPPNLLGRVTSLSGALSFAGIPLGGLLCGAAIAALGLSPALLVAGALYFAVTVLPAFNPVWREMDSRPVTAGSDPEDPAPAAPATVDREQPASRS